jgi:DNA repair protein RadD
MFLLRPYQEAAKAAVYGHLRTRNDNPCVVIPTAGGKTPLIASICKDAVGVWGGRVLILAHKQELLEQTADKLNKVCPEIRFGIYSAGLRRRDAAQSVIVAGIQSVYRRACDLGAFDLILIDEAHMIPLEGDGMYRRFLADARKINPEVRIIGFTATPFRLKTGSICTPDGFLNHICYEVGVRELIVQNYLCRPVTKAGRNKPDFSRLRERAGEFETDETEKLMDSDQLVRAACAEIVAYARERRAVLIFASGIKHGEHIVSVLKEVHGITCGFITCKTPSDERKVLLEKFKKGGQLKYLCNVDVLTTGFDATIIDCVVLLRPTASTGLYYQMVGRGFRLHPDKDNCLVLDFGDNVLRHGPVDCLSVNQDDRGLGQAPAKECPKCRSLIAAGYSRCPDCGYQFPPRQRKQHSKNASDAKILSREITTKCAVLDVSYWVHVKRDAGTDAPLTMRVIYKVGRNEYKSEFICFGHKGYPRQKAAQWWGRRSREPVPETVEDAVAQARAGRLAPTRQITFRPVAGKVFDEIIGYELGDIPPALKDEDLPKDAFDFPFGHNAPADGETP